MQAQTLPCPQHQQCALKTLWTVISPCHASISLSVRWIEMLS